MTEQALPTTWRELSTFGKFLSPTWQELTTFEKGSSMIDLSSLTTHLASAVIDRSSLTTNEIVYLSAVPPDALTRNTKNKFNINRNI